MTVVDDEKPAQAASGRFAAGEDPAKRDQILDGAKRAFMKHGFDAASMNDVTREAGVSKGTIYVYFQSKEDLFAALINNQKQKFAAALRDILADEIDLHAALRRYARAFTDYILTSEMIPAMRMLLAVQDRMPHLCKSFMQSGPENVRTVLEDYLEVQVKTGRLVIVDTELAARQFIELATGAYFKKRLFGEIEVPPPQAEIDYIIDNALHIFMLAYDRKAESGPEAQPAT
ncbi:TetR/AcrR family transcriptional regulator [Agrobacterium vitis]|uniref:TetR/AcrR family transcriptional regulator n=1 Tax=Agrobacterium vitis TaxID=373 RepID=A0A368NRT7_AGRVI|nr:TetR/AcrR family transcriptional regulator [Agrobacterium vitis]KAA3517684.1 TetR/AcrR family transcriptional regulator [Agrobacterium vitis]KAA3523762.1 TetR/AcrR family transcriptional regulator [Agrobacterium vitis]KAA3524115.1 TetR/AcrR family transcriptional regulator [Agrobacterium vitis]MCF1476876.1 TetR/AcrR family transcriptional regulator [Agrobacterium vitis]MUZ96016.1 TetR family transcriptional regulator [Agrobacterium vitis]